MIDLGLTLADTPTTAAPAGATANPTASAAPAQTTIGVPGGATTTASPTGGTTTTVPATATPGQPGAPAARPSSGLDMFMLPLIAVMVLMVVMSIFSGRKEKKRRAELLSNLKKQDKVVMSSGVVGYIEELTDDEVVIRSETSRLRFAKSTISQVLMSAKGGKSDTIAEPKTEREAVKA